mmetsp:Transcript_40477/g.120033  ORF Transcript_40477/g.120033 Transcript_40477/m.120033 type:complete len:663 (-) Transcript_40477:137-2125(-)
MTAARRVLLFVGLILPARALNGARQAGASLETDGQLGLTMPAPGSFGFSVAGPSVLAEIAAGDDVSSAASAAFRTGSSTATVVADLSTGKLSMQTSGAAPNSIPVAWAKYDNTAQNNGWAYLSVGATDDSRVSRDMTMYAAGYLEGYLSAQQIRDFHHNAQILMQEDEDKHHALGNIQDMFSNMMLNVCNKSGMHAGQALTDSTATDDAWWKQARYALLQAWGTLDAYNHQASSVNGQPMSLVDLIVLNSDGETPELEMAFDMEETLLRKSQNGGASEDDTAFLQRRATHLRGKVVSASARKAAREQEIQNLDELAWLKIKRSGGRCSALVRLTDDNKDLMVGHTTFSDYSEMNRIFKYYDLPLGSDSVRKMGFSSYPGVAGSTDDYYLLDSGLVITETTISMLTDEPYDKLPEENDKVPDFMRIMMSNRLAKTAPDWTDLMKKSSTGTYSSQWMVVDYNQFTPGNPVGAGTLMVTEQVPGMTHTEDMSSRLQDKRYWASENRAWYSDVRQAIGATEAESLHGALFSADNNPRGQIFQKTAPKVQNLVDMQHEMRRNNWPNEDDGAEYNTPDHAIAARGDLDKDHPNPNGGVDSKVTNSCLAKLLQCDAISGPTSDTQKPFRWNDESGKELYPGVPHDGMPNLWNFDWVRMTPGGEGGSDCA